MTLNDWLARIEQLHPKSIDMGLSRVRAVFDALSVKPACPTFLVSGTNGKGSTCAMLSNILRTEGYRVGLYTSPHLVHFAERIRVNGVPADEASLVAAFEKVDAARGDIQLTFFEFTTLAAFVIFSAAGLDAWVIEVGLGGRLDATNLLDADCAIVVSIGLDHMDYLGPTREHIAREKLGIARAGKVLVWGEPSPPENVAEMVNSEIRPQKYLRRNFEFSAQADGPAQWTYTAPDGSRMALPYPALRGGFQIHNAALALTALAALRDQLPVRAASIRMGLLTVDWPGRFQVLPGRPTVVLDAAHNPHAAAVLADALSGMGFHPETIAVFGMLNDKDAGGVVAALKSRVTRWHLAPTLGARGRSAESLAEALRAQNVPSAQIFTFDSVENAYVAAHKIALEADRIVVLGSFHILGDVQAAIALQRRAAL